MKALLAVVCFCAIAAFAKFTVPVGSQKALLPINWDDSAHKKTTISITSDKVISKVEVRLVRRLFFAYEDSALWLCAPLQHNCIGQGNNSIFNQTFAITALGQDLDIEFAGEYFSDLGEVTVKACEDHCVDECPGDCNGHGACVASIEKCFCDAGYHTAGTDCFSSGLDWFWGFILIGCGILLFFILLTIVLVCICCCCCCGCCDK